MIGFFPEKGHGPSHIPLMEHSVDIMSLVINGQPVSTGRGGGRAGVLSWKHWPRCPEARPALGGSQAPLPAAQAWQPQGLRLLTGRGGGRGRGRGGGWLAEGTAYMQTDPKASGSRWTLWAALPRADPYRGPMPLTRHPTPRRQHNTALAPLRAQAQERSSAHTKPFPSASQTPAPGSPHGAREPPAERCAFGG